MAENSTQAAGTGIEDAVLGYVLIVDDTYALPTIYTTLPKAEAAAQKAADAGKALWIRVRELACVRDASAEGVGEHTPEPPLPVSELVWVPNGDGWYARDTDNRGTYTVTHVSVSNGIDSSADYWRWKYEDDDGNAVGSSGGSSSGAAAKHSAQRHETERVRAAAWADYMRDNNPPTT